MARTQPATSRSRWTPIDRIVQIRTGIVTNASRGVMIVCSLLMLHFVQLSNECTVSQVLVQSCYDNRYCCFGARGCDCSKTSLFELDPATFITTLPLSTATSPSLPATNSATTTQASATSSNGTASPSSSIEPGSPASSKSHLGVAVGAGVGAGLAVVIIGAITTYLCMRRRKKQMMAELSSDAASYKKGYSIPLMEADGRSAPQEIGSKEPAHELDGGEMNNKTRTA